MKRRTFFGAIAGLFCLPWRKAEDAPGDFVIPAEFTSVNIEELFRQRYMERFNAELMAYQKEIEHLVLYGDGSTPPLGVLTINQCREMDGND